MNVQAPAAAKTTRSEQRDAARHRHARAAGWHGERIACLDRLKVLLIGAIIAGHGVMGYSSLEGVWPYQEVQEVALKEVSEVVLWIAVLPAVLFAMGLFLLICGLLTPRPMHRKGPQDFARARLVRLGLPRPLLGAVAPAAEESARDRHAGERARRLHIHTERDVAQPRALPAHRALRADLAVRGEPEADLRLLQRHVEDRDDDILRLGAPGDAALGEQRARHPNPIPAPRGQRPTGRCRRRRRAAASTPGAAGCP